MKIYKIVLWLIVIGIGCWYGGSYFNKKIVYDNNTQQTVVSSKSELEKIMEEESFKKITVLRARKVANDNKKAIEVERNKQAMSAIESEYEAIRTEELSLVGTTSLK